MAGRSHATRGQDEAMPLACPVRAPMPNSLNYPRGRNSLKESKPPHTYARARAHLRRTATRLHGDGKRVGLLLGGPPEHPPEPLPQRVPESPPPIPVAHLPFEALDRRLQLVQASLEFGDNNDHDASRPRPSPMLQPLLSSHAAVQSESIPIIAMNPVAPPAPRRRRARGGERSLPVS